MQFRVVLHIEEFLVRGIWVERTHPVVLVDTDNEQVAIEQLDEIKVLIGRELGYQRIARRENEMESLNLQPVGPPFFYAGEILDRWVIIEVTPIVNGRVERILDFNDRDDREAAGQRALNMNADVELIVSREEA